MYTKTRYFLLNAISEEFYEVTETEFFEVVGYDRGIVPMKTDENNINKHNFFLSGEFIGYSIRTVK